ncbi:alpha-L-rhamnosidase [Companilactobacillus suantsaicola]|uniref:alpha-L-rhamnosidase n=1 Tax=Companilactobacillus suantsaicola TaxID=2487723 RepID=A0A4Z0JR43_9LACO|nr:family 78 glycoside hydrolase catalytic domain [Companilactobacillus suantsaicola]TGD24627.1 alpha-L-rhamnosidase [Companilactobacillus suantsaicola]
MKIDNLKVNGISEPLGYSFPYLTFSWKTTVTDSSTTLLLVSKDKDFDNIVVEKNVTAVDNQITINNDFLQPCTRYYWKVQIGEFEAISLFETAKMDQSWTGQWISYNGKSQNSVQFSKEFDISKKVLSARLYIVGYGLYEPYLNDEKISNEYLLPGYHSYDLVNSYQTFDVTNQLKQQNKLKILTGNGWYKGRFIFEGGQENIYGDKQKMIAELHLKYTDGSSEAINSNKGWSVETTEVQNNSIYDGEVINYKKAKSKLEITTNDDTHLLTARHDLPIVKSKSLKPKKIFLDENNDWVVDFGQEITGWVEFGLSKNISNVKIYFGELLQNGKFYNKNLRTAKQEFEINNNHENHYVRPHFTYFGFRFIKIEGLNKEQIQSVRAYTLQSKIDETFGFNSSNRKINRLVENAQWSQRDNSVSIPTDCPQRDERMGWTGDVTIFSNTAMYNSDMRAFYANYLYNLSLEQKQMNGSIPFFAPYPKIKPFKGINPFLVTNGASTWGDVATILPMNLWNHYHDKGLLRFSLPIMKGWVDFVHQRDISHGDKHLWDFDQQLGDWLSLDNGNISIGATDPGLIASVYYYRSTNNLARAFDILKEPNNQYHQLARQIKQAIIDKYFDSNELNIKPLTQTGIAIVLNHQLYPNDDAKCHLISQLKELLSKNDDALNTGFIGTPELLHSLADVGQDELAYKLLMREKYPSWLFEVDRGSTTIWERWNSLLEDGKISGTDMNSLNHYAYGSVEDFIIEKMLGINLTNVNGKYIVRPHYTNVIKMISGSLETPNGQLKIKYSYLNNNEWSIDITVPNKCTVEFIRPDKEKKILTSGSYHLQK